MKEEVASRRRRPSSIKVNLPSPGILLEVRHPEIRRRVNAICTNQRRRLHPLRFLALPIRPFNHRLCCSSCSNSSVSDPRGKNLLLRLRNLRRSSSGSLWRTREFLLPDRVDLYRRLRRLQRRSSSSCLMHPCLKLSSNRLRSDILLIPRIFLRRRRYLFR